MSQGYRCDFIFVKLLDNSYTYIYLFFVSIHFITYHVLRICSLLSLFCGVEYTPFINSLAAFQKMFLNGIIYANHKGENYLFSKFFIPKKVMTTIIHIHKKKYTHIHVTVYNLINSLYHISYIYLSLLILHRILHFNYQICHVYIYFVLSEDIYGV